MKRLARIGAAFAIALGVLLAAHAVDLYETESIVAAVGPGLAMVGDLTVAAVMLLWGFS
jgi:hypothetical protein